MRTVIIGGAPGVRAYDNVKAKIEASGCVILKEIPAGAVDKRGVSLPQSTELALVLTTWASHGAVDKARAALKGRHDVAHVFSPHQWSRLSGHLARVGVKPIPVRRRRARVPRTGTPTQPQPAPVAVEDTVNEVEARAANLLTEAQRERASQEGLRDAIMELVIEMKGRNIARLTVTDTGKVEMEKRVITQESFDLGL